MSTGPTEPRQADGRLVLAFVCATAFAVVLNGTMLPVALPEIGEALSLGPVALGWIITSYFLVNGVAIPFFGRLADLHGVDRLYTIGLAVFFFGSFLCVVAPGFGLLMAGRLVQGSGAAAVVGLGPTAVSLVFPPESRGRSLGLVGAAIGAGAASGPVLGGLVTDLVGWRWLFGAGILFGPSPRSPRGCCPGAPPPPAAGSTSRADCSSPGRSAGACSRSPRGPRTGPEARSFSCRPGLRSWRSPGSS